MWGRGRNDRRDRIGRQRQMVGVEIGFPKDLLNRTPPFVFGGSISSVPGCKFVHLLNECLSAGGRCCAIWVPHIQYHCCRFVICSSVEEKYYFCVKVSLASASRSFVSICACSERVVGGVNMTNDKQTLAVEQCTYFNPTMLLEISARC